MMKNYREQYEGQIAIRSRSPKSASRHIGRKHSTVTDVSMYIISAEWPEGSPVYAQEIQVVQDYLSIEIDGILPSSSITCRSR